MQCMWELVQSLHPVVLSRYWVSVTELLKRVRLWWPWTSEHVLAGDLERSYVAHLLKADSHLLSVGGCGSIVVLHVSRQVCVRM